MRLSGPGSTIVPPRSQAPITRVAPLLEHVDQARCLVHGSEGYPGQPVARE